MDPMEVPKPPQNRDMGRSKVTLNKWGYTNNEDLDCDCGSEPQTMQHLLRCPLLEQIMCSRRPRHSQ